MKKFIQWMSIFLMVIAVAGCDQKQQLTWHQAMTQKIQRYTGFARSHLYPYFKRAGVSYPPKKLGFLIFKKGKKLELYAKSSRVWRYVRTFPILAASGGVGPKLHSGDRQVPEGIYHIVGLNPESHFDLSMHLNYPNAFDRKHADLDHRNHLGGDIYIHGNKRSIGCVAIGNKAIQQLFPLVYYVGIHNVTVIIAPNDLRTQKPVFGRVQPKWLPILYLKILKVLQQFPLPK